MPTWRAVFEAVAAAGDDAGVVAIESLLAGTIRETYDLLSEFYDRGVRIVGEVSVPVRLALVALPGQSLDDIERVYSHAQALAQADAFLRSRDWQVHDDLQHGRRGADDRRRPRAGGGRDRVTARRRPLRPRGPRRQRPERRRSNRTRFAVLALEGASAAARAADPGARKTTLVFAVRNVPGSLHRCLGAFATRGVNLSRLESRPARTARWEYDFWVDIDADAADPTCAAAIDDLRAETQMVRVLGSYPAARED